MTRRCLTAVLGGVVALSLAGAAAQDDEEESDGTFTYQVQSGARHARLCSTDSITVLETTGRGFNCGLGLFEPLSQEQADSVVGKPNPSVVSVPVELPKEEEVAEPAPEPAPEPPPQSPE